MFLYYSFLASLVAVMGEFDISGDLESKRAVTKNVKRVIVHRQYDPATFENDIALLELESPVQFDTHIGKTLTTIAPKNASLTLCFFACSTHLYAFGCC